MGRRGYGFAITLLSLRDISPIRGITPSPTVDNQIYIDKEIDKL